MSEKEHIEDVSHGSEREQEVLEALRASFLDRKFDSSWRPAKVQLIANNTLVEEYQEKKQDFLVRGRKGEELKEKYGFFVENNVAILELITRMGLQGRDSEYNALGYNRMGVYLCKHGDVCLQHALVKHSGSLVMRMVMCKYVAGRPTTAIPRVASAAEFIEPTQGFDCHESVINPDPRDSLQNKFDRSQVYLYEINKLLQPSPRPRQVQPFAVVSFTQNGAYLPIIDAEATAAERMASTVAQQNIANIINSKETLTPQPGAAAVMANPGPGIIGPAPVAGPQAPPSSGVGAPVVNTSPPGAGTQAAGAGGGPGAVQQNGINGHAISPTGEEKDPVKSAVTQLNVKLGSSTNSDLARRDSYSSASPAANRQVTPSPAQVAQFTATNPVHSITAPIPSSFHLGQNRLVRMPNGVGPAAGVFLQPYQNHLPAGMMPSPIGASPFPGGLPAGLVPAQPGLLQAQPQLQPGQPGLLHNQPGLLSAPPGHIFPAGQPGLMPGQPAMLQGQPGLLQGQPALFQGQPGLIQGQPGLMAGTQAGLLPGGQQILLPMSAPSSVGKPLTAGMVPGFPMFSVAGIPGGLPNTKTTTATQLGQSRPITPEVPTAGYVANNVSGYTPAIMGGTVSSPNGGQPIPVLTNGSVQTLPASQQGALPGAQQLINPGLLQGIPGLPGLQMVGGIPGAPPAAAANMAAFPGLASQAPAYMPQITYVGAHGQQLNAFPQGLPKVGQNGLLQQAMVPVQGIPAQSLKRPIADPYAVIDKRIRLA